MKRRQFITGTLGTVTAGAFLTHGFHNGAAKASPQETAQNSNAGAKHPIRLGAPVFFSEDDPDAWAMHARKKYRAVYAPNVSLDDATRIKAFTEAVKKHDLVIAEVGAWCNMLDHDPEKKKNNIENVIRRLALAEELGARCAVNIAGSFNPQHWDGPHPKDLSREFFDQTVENARRIIDAVKPRRAKFALEMMPWALPDTTDSYLELIKAIDREGFGVHVDICNMINSPKIFWDTTALINDCFDRLGPWIVSCHAKDLKWVKASALHFQECPHGEGSIDYGTYLKRIATHPDRDLPLMIEHMPDEKTYDKCREHLYKVAAENQLVFDYV